MSKRRTHPSYLSDDEAARERARTREMVRNLVGISQSGISSERKQAKALVRWKGTTRLGETDNFIVDYDAEERLVIIYGKEVPVGSSFRLELSRSQAVGIRELLKSAIYVMRGTQRMTIGEKGGFVVDYDGKLVMLYRKEAECRFGLAFDRNEVAKMVRLLTKTHNLF